VNAPHLRAAPIVAALALCALLLSSAGAGATTYCVNKPACVSAGGTSEGGDLQAALTAAAGSAGSDRIEIGPGFYSHAAGFSYNAVDPVQLVGSGTQADWLQSATLLSDGTANPTSETVLRVSSATPSTVSNLAIQLPGGTNTGNTGLNLTGGTADGVDVRGDNPADAPTGVQLTDAAFVNGRVQTFNSFGIGIRAVSGTLNRVADSTVDGDVVAVQAAAGATVRVERSRLRADAAGVQVRAGATASIDSTSIVFRNVVDYIPAGGIVFANESGAPSTVDAENVTLLGNGQVGSAGVMMENSFSRAITLTLRNSVISGYPKSIDRVTAAAGSQANLTTDHSAYAPVADTGTVNGTLSESARLDVADPGFLDASGLDVHLRADSPLIDAGAEPGGGSATDLARQPRVVDGHGTCAAVRDIGAYEFQPGPRAPHAAASATPGAAKTGQAVTFGAAGSCDPDLGDALSFAWSFDDGATAAGATVTHAFAAAGVHSATVTATDAGGHRATATALVTVTKPFAGLSISTRKATERNGAVGIALACPEGTSGRCTGTLSLTARASSKRHAKLVTLGSARVSIAAGKKATLAVKLSHSGLALLHRSRSLKATATVAGKDGAGSRKTTHATVALKAATKTRRA
jgi:PKD domain